MAPRSSLAQAFFASRNSTRASTRSSESENDSSLPMLFLRVFRTTDSGSVSTSSQPVRSQFLMTTEGSGHSVSFGRPTLMRKSPGDGVDAAGLSSIGA